MAMIFRLSWRGMVLGTLAIAVLPGNAAVGYLRLSKIQEMKVLEQHSRICHATLWRPHVNRRRLPSRPRCRSRPWLRNRAALHEEQQPMGRQNDHRGRNHPVQVETGAVQPAAADGA